MAKRGSDAAKVEQAFWICFSRPPDALERAKCLEFVKQQRLAKRQEWTALDGIGLDETRRAGTAIDGMGMHGPGHD